MKKFIYNAEFTDAISKNWFKNWWRKNIIITNKDYRIKRKGYKKLIVWQE